MDVAETVNTAYIVTRVDQEGVGVRYRYKAEQGRIINAVRQPVTGSILEPTLGDGAALSPAGADFKVGIERLAGELVHKSVSVPADISALIVGMTAQGSHKLIVTSPDPHSLEGIKSALFLAEGSRDVDTWLDKLELRLSTGEMTLLRLAVSKLPNKTAAFEQMRTRFADSGYDFLNEDIKTGRGAAAVNREHSSPLGAIHTEPIVTTSSCSSSRRRRRAVCSPEEEIAEINEQATETTEALTLLSDDETRILTGNSADDIALHISEPGSVLAKVQDGIYDFRRSSVSRRMEGREGYHNVIAIDDESFSAAQALAGNSNEEGRALKLSTDARGNPILLAEDGRVVTMIEGGSRNRLSIVGRAETLEAYSASDMAAGVSALTQGESIGSVTVHPVLEQGETLNHVDSFQELEVTDKASPWRKVAGTVRLQALEKKALEKQAGVPGSVDVNVVESGHMQVGVPGEEASWLFDGDYLRDALNLGTDHQPGALERQLRDKLAELHQQGHSAERETFESLTLDYASKVRDLQAKFEVFRAAMDQVYAANPQLTSDDIPLLNTLHEVVSEDGARSWQMQFSDHDINASSLKVITIEDERIIRYVNEYDEQIGKVRRALRLNHATEEEIRNIQFGAEELPEFVDGMGLGMAMQTVIELEHRERDEEQLKKTDQYLPPDYRRALIVHQGLALVFGGRVVLGVALDVGKYFAALSDGRIVTLPERFASRIVSFSERVGGVLGKGLSATAKVVKVSGQILDGALTLVSIGLDITELATANTTAARTLAGVQLGLDLGSGLVAGAGITASALASVGVAGAATASGILGAVAVPLAGIAIGVSGLAQNFIVIEGDFDNTMRFFHGVYEDLTLSDKYAFNRTSGVLNMLARPELDEHGNFVYDDDDNGRQKYNARLAPFKEINFRDGTAKYGSIQLPEVKGGWGSAIFGYIWEDPVHWQGKDEVGLFQWLDHCLVKEQLRKGLTLPPEDQFKAVVLPSQSDWHVKRGGKPPHRGSWHKHTAVPGATTWHVIHRGESGGWWMLEAAERKGCNWHLANNYFAATYVIHTMIFIPVWFIVPFIIPIPIVVENAMSLNYEDYRGRDNSQAFQDNNFDFSTSPQETDVILPNHNLTIQYTNQSIYKVYGTGSNNYTLIMPDQGGSLTLYSSGSDQWVIHVRNVTNQQLKRGKDNRVNLGINNALYLPDFSKFTKNLTIFNPDDQYQFYLFDPVANWNGTVLREIDNLSSANHTILETLQEQYRHPGGALNRVQRFHRIGGTDWVDFASDEEGGLDLHIPAYFYGVIQKDEILSAGLFVEVYRTLNWAPLPGLNAALNLINQGNRGSNFIASHLDYSVDSGHRLGSYLGQDSQTLFGRGLNHYASIEGMVFNYTGLIQLEAGAHTFIIGSDEGFRLSLNQRVVASHSANREFTNTSAIYTAPASGLYPIELIHWDNKGVQKLHAVLDGYTLNNTRLFNRQREGITATMPLMPEDTRPIAGWPDCGYMLYSRNTQSMFYRQPFNASTDTSSDDANILKLPRQYKGANFNSESENGHHIAEQTLTVTSSGNIQYQLKITTNHSEPFVYHPTLKPQVLVWNASNYQSSIQETNQDSHPHPDLVPGIFIHSESEKISTCSSGFYDAMGDAGHGRVAVLSQGTEGQAQIDYVRVGSAAYSNNQLLNSVQCFDLHFDAESHGNISDSLAYLPVHVVHEDGYDLYLSWHRGQQKLYLSNLTVGDTPTTVQKDMMPLDLLLHEVSEDNNSTVDHLDVTFAHINQVGDGIVAVTACIDQGQPENG